MDEKESEPNENPDCANEDIAEADRIKKLEEEIEALRNTLLRMAAETENLRKRLEKEKSEAVKYANVKFAKDLLAVLDNFERISGNCSASVREKIESAEGFKAFFDGILLCEKELLSIFKRHVISPLKTEKGNKFDPECHQAVCELESSDHEVGSVIQVLQNGYIYHDRLLRPAMVSVSKKT
jgi:molecular chaperone GrpE